MISYILEVTICWMGFYGLYALLLRKTTFFGANRAYLLGTLLLGLLVPLLELPAAASEAGAPPVVYYLQPITVGVEQLEVTVTDSAARTGFDYYALLKGLYWIGVLLAAGRFAYGLRQIARLYRRGRKERHAGYTLVRTGEAHLPFSFFGFLFWSDRLELAGEDSRTVLRHERAHISGGHSLDVLLLELLCVFLWCSPLLYCYRRSLRTVHEYLADSVVLQTTRRKKYGHLLLRQSQSGMQIALANHFLQSQLKQRIIMMTRHQSDRRALLRYTLAIPLLVLFLLAFAHRDLIGQTLLEIHQADGTVLHKEVQDMNAADELFAPEEVLSIEVLKEKDLNKVIVRMKGAAPAASPAEEKPASFQPARPDGGADIRIATGLEGGAAAPDRILLIAPDGATTAFEYDPALSLLEDYDIDPNDILRIEVLKEEENIVKIYLKQALNAPAGEGNTLPRFPGCEDEADPAKRDTCAQKKLLEFVYTNIHYPLSARQAGREGTVVVQFTIKEDGSVGRTKLLRDIGEGAGQEVLRVINDMPRWIPAQKDGKPVAAEFNLPVKFQLEGKNADLAWVHIMDGVPEEEQQAPIFQRAEVMPRFPGCEELEGTQEEKRKCANQELIAFISEHIRYPQAAREAQLEGTVLVQFTVFADGTIGDSKVLRDIGGGAGEEALRVVGMMPEWIPGQEKGKAVAVQFNLPVQFKLGAADRVAASSVDRRLELTDFSAAPNPASDQLQLRFRAEAAPLVVRLSDLSGREVFRNEVDDFDGFFDRRIDLSRVAKGPLLLSVEQGDQVFTEKIIVQ